MRLEPDISGVDLILVGSFNPAIFTPSWFALHDLLPRSVAETAELEIAHEQISMFTADWLRLEVRLERLIAETSQAPYARLRKFISFLFGQYLYHTPISAFSINRRVHFQVPDLVSRDRIMRTLAPVESWGKWSQDLGTSGKQGGMSSVTMTQVNPKGRAVGGRISARVELSNQIGQGLTGVFVQVNDHFTLNERLSEPGKQFMHLVNRNFDDSLIRSNDIIDHIMSLASPVEC